MPIILAFSLLMPQAFCYTEQKAHAHTFVLFRMKQMAMFIPPAGAVSILAMLIPEQAVLWFPVQITVGAALMMSMAIRFFKKEQPEDC